MPNPEKGCDDVNSVFHEHLYRYEGSNNKVLAAAIMGVHTIGSAKLENSGYRGSWTVNNGVFDN